MFRVKTLLNLTIVLPLKTLFNKSPFLFKKQKSDLRRNKFMILEKKKALTFQKTHPLFIFRAKGVNISL